MIGKLRVSFPALAALLIAGAGARESRAAPVTFTFSTGDRAASATFDTSGTRLIVTLTNTSTADVMVPTDVLTAVFFSLTGDPNLGRVSAILNTGSTVIYDSQPAGGVVGGEWAYNPNITVGSSTQGISSTGL